MPTFELSRSTTVASDPATVHALINDFHEWRQWSPWEDRDPQLERTYSGADAGVGTRYEWHGNRQVGEGAMEITASTPERIEIDLRFLKPMQAHNQATFQLRGAGANTEVTWTMTGNRNAVMHLLGKAYFDQAVGRDFEKGLARLKAAAERPAQ